MPCFWTNAIGCLDDCGGVHVYGGTAPGAVEVYVDVLANATGFVIGASNIIGAGGDIAALADTSIVLTRIDFYDDGAGCGQTVGAPPAWFPPQFTGTVAIAGAPTAFVSPASINLTITKQTFVSNGAQPATGFIVSMAALSAAMGGADVSAATGCVAYVEVLAANGLYYYGAVVGNFCF